MTSQDWEGGWEMRRAPAGMPGESGKQNRELGGAWRSPTPTGVLSAGPGGSSQQMGVWMERRADQGRAAVQMLEMEGL